MKTELSIQTVAVVIIAFTLLMIAGAIVDTFSALMIWVTVIGCCRIWAERHAPAAPTQVPIHTRALAFLKAGFTTPFVPEPPPLTDRADEPTAH